MDTAQPPMRSPYDPGWSPIPPGGAATPPSRRLHLSLAIVAGMIGLLCMGGIGMAYALYDKATAPDRSAPDVAVDNYLRALLIERDDVKARLFLCRSPQVSALEQLRDDLQMRERKHEATISIHWGRLDARVDGESAVVTTELKMTAFVGDAAPTEFQRWTFETRQEDGWRVCAATRVD